MKIDNTLIGRLERHKQEVECDALIQQAIDEIKMLRGELQWLTRQAQFAVSRIEEPFHEAL
jgi:hypothetical protein